MPRKKNNLLALDPGTREIGYACFTNLELTDYGVKYIKNRPTVEQLLTAIENSVRRMIQEKRPFALALEKNNFSQIKQNVRLTMAIARMKAVAKDHKIRVFEYDPRTIRKVICNNGNATKREVARILAVRYPEMRAYLESNRRWRERYYQNAFDAIACGLTFATQANTFSGYNRRKR